MNPERIGRRCGSTKYSIKLDSIRWKNKFQTRIGRERIVVGAGHKANYQQYKKENPFHHLNDKTDYS
jgi:hypothetical protein